MNWMNSREGSWLGFAAVAFVVMILFLMSSCDGPTPTDTLVPTDTSEPVITIALAPTGTPTQSYPTPILVNPSYGATIIGEELTHFSWQWDGVLQEGEWFDLRIWRPEKPRYTVSIQRDGSCTLDTPPDGFGHYLWKVAVVRIDESGSKSTLCESPIWPFVWSEVSPPDAVVNTEALNLRSGPGVVYDILGGLKRGDPLTVTGRNPAGDWLKVIAPGGQEGWAACSLLQVNVDMAGVPVGMVPSTPSPVYTPTPTPKPTPELLPPPILLEPEDGATFIGGPVALKWQWVRPLEPDEIFSVRAYKEGEKELCHHSQVHGFEYVGDLTNCSAGKHYWGVAVSRQLCKDCPIEEMWQKVSEPSAERWIYYTPGTEPWEPTREPPPPP